MQIACAFCDCSFFNSTAAKRQTSGNCQPAGQPAGENGKKYRHRSACMLILKHIFPKKYIYLDFGQISTDQRKYPDCPIILLLLLALALNRIQKN
ncbi:MAG: hypothetical protein GY862_09240 [Gammaproteobacteria bacterium]|nr:hypothetical protein [Gammaproteobacteria bacterium]